MSVLISNGTKAGLAVGVRVWFNPDIWAPPVGMLVKKEEFLSEERKFHKSLTGIKRIMFHVKHFWSAIGKMQQPEKKQSFFIKSDC